MGPPHARKVLTEGRLEIIETIRDEDIESIRDLARMLDSGENVVYDDLTFLFEEGIIDCGTETNRKMPVLRHGNTFLRPITLKPNKTDGIP